MAAATGAAGVLKGHGLVMEGLQWRLAGLGNWLLWPVLLL
jgi:hypothetical protein